MSWAVIAGLLAIILALTGTVLYLATQPARERDAARDAEAQARESHKSLAAVQLALYEAKGDLAKAMDNWHDERAMLIADIEAQKRTVATVNTQLAQARKQRDDLLEAIGKNPAQGAALALLIRRDLERLREEAARSAVPDPAGAPGDHG